MKQLLMMLRKKLQPIISQPRTGARVVISSLYKKRSSLRWANIVVSGMPWLLMLSVCLVTWLSLQSGALFRTKCVYLVLSFYALYILTLIVVARPFKKQYESQGFRTGRIAITFLFVTMFVSLYPGSGSYFWFFYALPILQSIVYLSKRGILFVSISSIVTYWILILFGISSLHHSSDYGLMVMNSLILSVLSLVLYGLFRSAQENKEENVNLLEKTRRNLVRLETLNHLNGRINAAPTLTDILQVVLTEGLRAIRCNEGSIMLINPFTDELEIQAWIVKGEFAQGKEHRSLAKEEGIAGWVTVTRQAYNCLDTLKDRRFTSSHTGRQPRSLLSVPIIAEESVVGVINADSPTPHFFEPEDVEFLSALAGNLAIAVEKARLHEEISAQHERAQWMVSMLIELQIATAEMQSELELSTLLNLISKQAAKLLKADSGCILLLDEVQQILKICGSYELSEKATQGTRDEVGDSIAGRVVQQQEPIIAHDIPNHPWFHNPAADQEGWLAIVSTPMWIDGKIIGTLDIHSKTNIHAFTYDDLKVLSLMARQAEVAIKQAQLFEAEHRQNQAFGLVQRVLQGADRSKHTNRLDAILLALTQEINQSIGGINLTIVLKNINGYWHYNLLNRLVSNVFAPRWLRPKAESLIVHIIKCKNPLFLSVGTEASYRQNNLSLLDTQAAQCWMGVPVVVGDLTVGAIALQDNEQPNAFTEDDYKLFQNIVRQLSGVIYAAWVDEQRTELYQQLTMLQSASEKIMLLAEQQEDWLWHAILTLATAHYGLRFERAVLFLYEKNGSRVRGRMGIGNFDRILAFQDWTKDENGGMTWERYLQDLQQGKLTTTAIEHFMRNWSLDLDQENSAFVAVLQNGEIQKVQTTEAELRLPHPFVEKFGICDYSLVPVKAGSRVLGLVVLSNPFKDEPHKDESLVYFAALANQAALIYENLHQRSRLTQFINIDHKVLVGANNQLLSNTLRGICQAAKDLMDADMVVIYPFKANNPTYEYDLANVGYAGDDQQVIVTKNRYPSFFTRHIMEEGIVIIPDIEQDTSIYGGLRAADHDFIQNTGTRALIGVPIRGPITHKLRGILYINFCAAHNFNEQEQQLAELFARLGNLAIRQTYDLADLRIDRQAKEEELQLLGDVLQQALIYGINESGLVKTMLEKTQKLFASPDVHFAISLLEWQKGNDVNTEPVELRRIYYLTPQGEFKNRSITENIYFGISGKAMQMNVTQFVLDVATEPAFYDRDIGTRSEIDVPVTTPAAQMIGVLTVESPQLVTLTEYHKEMLERLAAVLGLAIDNIRRSLKLRELLSAAAAIIAPTTLEATLQAVLEAARQVTPDLSLLTIWHKSPVTGEFILGKYFGVQDKEALRYEQPRKDGLISSVMKARKPIWAESFESKRLFTESNFIKREGLKSSVVFPLLVADELVGVLFFSYRQLHKFTAEEHLFFPILARIAAASINEALLMEKADREHKRLSMALDITEAVGAELNIEQTLTNILSRLTTDNLFPDTVPCILLYNKTTGKLDFSPASHAFYQIDNVEYINMTDAPLDNHSIAGSLALESIKCTSPILSNVGDVYNHASYQTLRSSTQSQLTVTLYSDRQGLLGILLFESAKSNAFDEDHESIAKAVAKQIQLALERAYLSTSLRRGDVVASVAFWAVDIAHFINSETGLIRNWASWLRDEPELSEDGQDYVKSILQAVAKLASVLPDLSLRWRKPERVDSRRIEEVLCECVEDFLTAETSDINFLFNFNTNNIHVKTELLSLGKVVRYIVQNALEAMESSPIPSLEIRTHVTDDHRFEIEIEDSGPGIADPKLHQSILNEPVASAKGEGHGYGLFFASIAVERSGGMIHLQPYMPNKGATFVISFPVILS